MRPEQRTKITRQLVRPKHRAYNFSSFFSGVGSILQNWNIQSKFFKFILPVPESNLYPLTLASVIACAGSVEEFILTQEWSLICTIYSWYPSLTCIHYASFGISVCRFRERIYSLTRVSLKFHDPCEVLARIWKAQNSPRLLPWIYNKKINDLACHLLRCSSLARGLFLNLLWSGTLVKEVIEKILKSWDVAFNTVKHRSVVVLVVRLTVL